MLILQTHFTEKCYLKLPKFTGYHSNYPAITARGESAMLIKNSINHHQLNNYSQDFLQATSMSVKDSFGLSTILTVYLPTKYTVRQEQLEDLYITLGCQCIARGDYNAKHTDWGSRLITPRGRGRTHILAPTNKLPDLVDWVRFPALPGKKKCSGSGMGCTQPREYKLRSYLIEK
jgi:hypothetical protein